MSLARSVLTAAWAAIALWSTPAAAGPVARPAPPEKPAEARTVGTTPQVLTTAERQKLALAGVARAARPSGSGRAQPSPVFLGPEDRRRLPPMETRVPVSGPRARSKPIHGAPEVAEREKGGGR